MKVWWLGGANGQGNFGDILTPAILDYFSIEYNFVKNYRDAEAICVGSIARRAGNNTKVLGSGIISRYEKINPSADWRFVRGPYTRQRVTELGGSCPEVYGDPGLLLPLLVEPSKKQQEVGIVPHNVDYHFIHKLFPNNFIIGLGTSDYRNIVKKITSCEKIISSSLHGIICAHAYDIPAAWVNPNQKLKGDDIKFKDYFESVGIYNYEKSTYENPVYINPGQINLNPLLKIFKELADEMRI